MNTSTPDRLPPHSDEAEQNILGAIMLDGSCLDECPPLIAEAFYDLRHAKLYEQFCAMRAELIPINHETTRTWLKDRNLLDQVGGESFVVLLEGTPTASLLPYYTGILLDKYQMRRIISLCTQFSGRAYDHFGEASELLDAFEMAVMAVRPKQGAEQPEIREVVRQAVGQIEFLHQHQGEITGLSTGLPDLDRLTNGLHPGEMTVCAAFPSVGKTSLAMNIAEHIILDLEQPVGVFSLEMSAVSLVTRMICSRSRVNLRSVNSGFLQDRDFVKLTSAAMAIARSRLALHAIGDLSIQQMRAEARRMKRTHGIKFLVVDYLQLLNASGGRKNESRQEEVAAISRGIKATAEELQIPVLVLSQLNDDGKLRESRAIGQDADGIWMLKRDNEDEKSPDVTPTTLLISKQRNGPRNVCVHLTFLDSITRFESAAKVSQEDMPKRTPHKN